MKRNLIICLGHRRPETLELCRSLGYDVVLLHNGEYKGTEAFDSLEVRVEDLLEGNVDIPWFEKFEPSNVKGILIPFEPFVELGAAIREKFFPDVVGLNSDQAAIARDKLRMKQFLVSAGIPTARFSSVLLETDYESLAKLLGPLFLVKPRKFYLAKGIRLIQSAADWALFVHQVPNRHDYIAEEYLSPIREFCCDTISIDGQIMAQCTGEYSVSCLDSIQQHDGFGVDFPGFLSPNEQGKARQLARKFVEHSGIHTNVFHIELLRKGDELYFGEAGVRIPGGHQFQTESLIADIDLYELYVKMMTRTVPSKITAKIKSRTMWDQYFGYYYVAKKPGRIQNIITDVDRPWVKSYEVLVREGDVVSLEDSSIAKSAFIVYEATNIVELRERSNEVKNLIRIQYS